MPATPPPSPPSNCLTRLLHLDVPPPYRPLLTSTRRPAPYPPASAERAKRRSRGRHHLRLRRRRDPRLDLALLDVLGVVTGNRLAVGQHSQLRHLTVAALGLPVGATCVKATSARRIGGRRQVSAQQHPLALGLHDRVR